MSHPHILFILCDELRADTLGYAGDTFVRTPHIDALAKDSVEFTSTYSASPMCVPSRASLATGRHPLAHGALDNAMPPLDDERSLYSEFKDQGYTMFSTGKWHTNANAEDWGFDTNLTDVGYPANTVTCFGITDPELRKQGKVFRNEGLLSLVLHGENPLKPEQTADSIYTQHMLNAVEHMDPQQPHFLRLSLLDPHSPYLPTQPYQNVVEHSNIPLPQSSDPNYSNKPRWQDFFYRARGFHHLKDEDYQKAKSCYYGLIQHNDDRIGSVLQSLKDRGLYDDMIIVFTSDHGAMMGEQGSLEKWGHLYEPVVKVPFLIKFPQSKWAGRQIDDFVENVDTLPTLLDWLGCGVSGRVHGKSLLPRLKGEVLQHRSDAISTYMSSGLMPSPAYMIRFDHWKATFYPSDQALESALPQDHFLRNGPLFDGPRPQGELYDLETDPYEINNLFDEPSYSEIVLEAQIRITSRQTQWQPQVQLPDRTSPAQWCEFRLLLEGSYHNEATQAFSDHCERPLSRES